MTEKDIIVGLNSIAAKYGYDKNGNVAFSKDEWNTIERAKEIIRKYETQNKRFAEHRAEVAERELFDFYKKMLAIPSYALAVNGMERLLQQAEKDIAEEKNNETDNG